MSSSRNSGCVPLPLLSSSPFLTHSLISPHLLSMRSPQANDNQLRTIPSLPESTHPALTTIYLEGNPLQKDLGTAYRRKVQLELPQLKQIDANFVRRS